MVPIRPQGSWNKNGWDALLGILCGTCAWADHHEFYPSHLKPKDRLAYYAAYFPLVEVDSSFYGIPNPRNVVEWVEATPDRFVFDVKVFRSLTMHDRQASYDDVRRDVAAMEDALRVLREAKKLGTVLFQFPPWFIHRPDHVAYLDTVRDWFPDDVVAIEFRHRSWWLDDDQSFETAQFLQERDFVNVVCDEPQSGMGTIPLVPSVTNPNVVMFRLHGRNADTWYQKGLTSSQQRFDYKYSREELSDLAVHVRNWSESAASVHVLMNNNQADYAIANAFDWLSILDLGGKPRPAKPGRQAVLFDELE